MPKRYLPTFTIWVAVLIFWVLLGLPQIIAGSDGRAISDRPDSDKHRASATAVDKSGNLYVTGPSSEILGEGSGYVTTKYDIGGNLLWAVRYADRHDSIDLSASLKLDDSGNTYVTFKDNRDEELVTVCYNPDGDQMWIRRYQSPAQGGSGNTGILDNLKGSGNDLSYDEGWPVILSGLTNQNVAAGDIDNDGMVEMVVSEFIPPGFKGSGDGHIYVLRHDGSLMEPWPDVDIEPYGLNPRSVSLGDLDGDGDLEIVFAAGCTPQTSGYTVYIFHHDGSKVTDGWPKTINGFAPVSPILEDIDDDGSLEIISKDGSDKISAWNFDGSGVSGWPFVVPDAGPLNYFAVGDVNHDGQKEVVAVQSSLVHHYVYVISNDGQLLNRWYIQDDIFGVAAFPALADLDKDVDLEILLYDCNKVHAYHGNGEYVNGWPVSADFWSKGGLPLSIGDMDGDHRLEVATTGCRTGGEWRGVSVWGNDGELVEGWPVTVDRVHFGYASSIGDVDDDDQAELLVTATADLYNAWRADIFAFNWDGTVVPGFPFLITDIRFGHVGNVVLQDTDQDDTVEAIFAVATASPTDSFMVGVINLSAAYDPVGLEWAMCQHDPRRTGLYSKTSIYVDDGNTAGPWHGTEEFPYRYIQDGIDSANHLDVIYVAPGTYHENLVVDKSVYLAGQNMDSTIVDAVGGGVGITISADLVTIWGFTVQNGDESGIYVNSDHNVILRNNIAKNYHGIRVGNFSGNRIYHNNFIANSQNAHDEGGNIWDNGYPSGGNYWDDYPGIDAYYGPNQDVPGSDGIGDAPYLISGGNNQDSYPLMNPWPDTLPVPQRDTVYVDDDFDDTTPGWGWISFNRIQEGLDIVVPGGAVCVANGTYYERISIDKTLSLIGQNRDSTIIDGGGSGNVVLFNRVHDVNLGGFTIRKGEYGVLISYDTYNNAVFDNIITDNQVGIYLMFTSSNTISGNIVRNSDVSGMNLQLSEHNTISGNTIADNEQGVVLHMSSDNTMSGNVVQMNELGIYSFRSGNNQLHHNDFIDNNQNAYDDGNNAWYKRPPHGGNYWHDYAGMDADGDGFGDLAYAVPGGDNEDRCPLMYPWTVTTVLVDDDADPSWYDSVHVSTIQEGADRITDDGCVYVHNGVYHENVTIDKSLNLVGQHIDSVIVDGSQSGDVLSISGDAVRIRGFTVQNSGSGSGINLSSGDNTVCLNRIAGNQYGVSLNSAAGNTISASDIAGNQYGVYFTDGSTGNMLNNLNIEDNQFGVYLCSSSEANSIYHNNFIRNTQSAYDEVTNIWDCGYPCGGNYWDDFDEPGEGAYDENEDGVVDSPYDILGGNNQDEFPLISPWEGTEPTPNCGDANLDGSIDIADLMFLINYLFLQGPAPDPFWLGDVNNDTGVNIADVNYLINYLFLDGPPPEC